MSRAGRLLVLVRCLAWCYSGSTSVTASGMDGWRWWASWPELTRGETAPKSARLKVQQVVWAVARVAMVTPGTSPW